MRHKKFKIFLILLGIVILGVAAWLTTCVYHKLHDPVWNYDISSMPAGSKIVRFEKCGELAFCGISDFRNERKFKIYYKDGKITSIIKLPPPVVKHRVEWELKLSPTQNIISKTIVADGQKLIFPHILCQYEEDGTLRQATFLNESGGSSSTVTAKQRCGTENPNQNPEVLKILRFFNSKEGKRMLQ